MEWIVLGFGAAMVIYLAMKGKAGGGDRKGGDPAPDPDKGTVAPLPKPPAVLDPVKPIPSTDRGDEESPIDDTIGKVGDKLKGWFGGITVPAPEPEPEPEPPPPQPGDGPATPLPSTALYPGFVGWFEVSTGDNLSKLAQRLGLGGTQWRVIRDQPENAWAVALCSQYVRNTYYGGEPGINLVARYGINPPNDCVARGYKGGLHSSGTGQFPVLYYGG